MFSYIDACTDLVHHHFLWHCEPNRMTKQQQQNVLLAAVRFCSQVGAERERGLPERGDAFNSVFLSWSHPTHHMAIVWKSLLAANPYVCAGISTPLSVCVCVCVAVLLLWVFCWFNDMSRGSLRGVQTLRLSWGRAGVSHLDLQRVSLLIPCPDESADVDWALQSPPPNRSLSLSLSLSLSPRPISGLIQWEACVGTLWG